ncbi:hypothetical protein [Variovorax sp. 38R]|uniref:hypothetical protein n=1 Tax=Variovorax sp. 38R TaxID=2774875 RepID=UPI00177DA5A2|nr:hypothetical protein [Variovorax sp. 38R]QOF78844.1 hypothetical protein IG196_00070 [Variovorax sp. 38R]
MLEAMTWIALVLAAVAAFFVLQRVVVRTLAGEGKAEAVRRRGEPATAVVLDTYDTGNRVARYFILTRLTLRVESSTGSFETTVTTPISPVKQAEFSPGRTIKVRVDTGTREVAVDQARR